jgi:hypothetical protein
MDVPLLGLKKITKVYMNLPEGNMNVRSMS